MGIIIYGCLLRRLKRGRLSDAKRCLEQAYSPLSGYPKTKNGLSQAGEEQSSRRRPQSDALTAAL